MLTECEHGDCGKCKYCFEWGARDEYELTCPYCGHKDSNSWEYILGNEDEGEHDCRDCGKTFSYTCDHSVTFTATQIEEPSC